MFVFLDLRCFTVDDFFFLFHPVICKFCDVSFLNRWIILHCVSLPILCLRGIQVVLCFWWSWMKSLQILSSKWLCGKTEYFSGYDPSDISESWGRWISTFLRKHHIDFHSAMWVFTPTSNRGVFLFFKFFLVQAFTCVILAILTGGTSKYLCLHQVLDEGFTMTV